MKLTILAVVTALALFVGSLFMPDGVGISTLMFWAGIGVGVYAFARWWRSRGGAR